MNITSHLPRWAQAPVQSFTEHKKISGTEVAKLDQDSFQSMSQLAGNILYLTASDEVPGEDEAMGQPGVVSSKGLTVHYEGDVSSSDSSVKAVASAVDGDSEIALYVASSPKGVATLQLAQANGQIQVEGAEVMRGKGGQMGGYVIAGTLS